MNKCFFDYEDGDFCNCISDSMAMDSKGHMLMRMSGNMAMDVNSGELHIISSWERDEDNGF
ncbi:MAG: hypothetical protein ACC608_07805 [Anaerofustis sp.]